MLSDNILKWFSYEIELFRPVKLTGYPVRPFYVPWLPSYESIIYRLSFIYKIVFILDTVI